jgi:hypothetical protein
MQSYDDYLDQDVSNMKEQVNQADMVNHPAHYTSSGGIECIDAIDACVSTYKSPVHAGLVWQVIKYLWRAPIKGHYNEDIRKAKWYLDRLVTKLNDVEAV